LIFRDLPVAVEFALGKARVNSISANEPPEFVFTVKSPASSTCVTPGLVIMSMRMMVRKLFLGSLTD